MKKRITRRTFLTIFSTSLTLLISNPKKFIKAINIPTLYGDGTYDDTEALEALLNGSCVKFIDGTIWKMNSVFVKKIPPLTLRINKTLYLKKGYNPLILPKGSHLIFGENAKVVFPPVKIKY